MKTPRLFVAGTDTGIGKTEVSCALLSLLSKAGRNPGAFKPYESGVDARSSAASDAERMRQAAGEIDPAERVCIYRLKLPLAPAVAAQREKVKLSFARAVKAANYFAGRPLIAEGAGGLRVPLDARRDVIDLISALKLPVLLVGRAGLGTQNHVALSLEALAARGISVAGVVLSQGTADKDLSVRDNARWIEARSHVPVWGPVPFVENPAQRRQAFERVLRPFLRSFLES